MDFNKLLSLLDPFLQKIGLSKTVVLGIIMVVMALLPLAQGTALADIDWNQVSLGLGMIFVRHAIYKASNGTGSG